VLEEARIPVAANAVRAAALGGPPDAHERRACWPRRPVRPESLDAAIARRRRWSRYLQRLTRSSARCSDDPAGYLGASVQRTNAICDE